MKNNKILGIVIITIIFIYTSSLFASQFYVYGWDNYIAHQKEKLFDIDIYRGFIDFSEDSVWAKYYPIYSQVFPLDSNKKMKINWYYNKNNYIIDYRDVLKAINANGEIVKYPDISKNNDYNWFSYFTFQDSIMYTTVTADWGDDTLTYRYVKYDFVNKVAKLINNPVYDPVSKDTIREIKIHYSAIKNNSHRWLVIYDSKSLKSNYNDASLLLCEIDSNDMLVAKCPYKYGFNRVNAKSGQAHICTYFNGDCFAWLESTIDTVTKSALSLVHIKKFGSDSIKTISSKDFGISKFDLPFSFRFLASSPTDSVLHIICASSEMLSIYPDGTHKVDYYLFDSIENKFDYWLQKIVYTIDDIGNIWFRCTSHPLLIKYDINGNWTQFNFEEYGNITSIISPVFYQNRYIVFVTSKESKKNNITINSYYLVFFDTKYKSGIDDRQIIENYIPKEIKNIKLYPNPTNTSAKLDLEFNHLYVKDLSIILYNSAGEQIKDFTNKIISNEYSSTFQIDTKHLPKGNYYLIIKSMQNNEVRRLVVE